MTQSGDRPDGRSGHSLTVVGRNAFLFGGTGERDSTPVLLNDIYSLDLQGQEYIQISFLLYN